jgi:hypothetical protein
MHPSLLTVSEGFSMRRLASRVLIVALLAGLIGAVPVSGALAEEAPVVALGFRSTDWAYEQVAYDGGPPGFEAQYFDDSAWAVGQAGFGTINGACPWNNGDQVHTAWSPGTDMLLRHEFSLPLGASGVHISGTVDNNADVYVNGALVQHVESGFCTADGINVDVPDAAIGQNNVVAIRARDLGSATFIDVQITYVPADPAVVIRAGDFNRVNGLDTPFGAPDAGMCTAGFAVVQGSTRYMLTAAHCRNWLDKNGNKAGHSRHVNILGPWPPAILAGSESEWFSYATALDCGGSSHLCLHSPESSDPDHDVMAWRPDLPSDTPNETVTPTGELQTDHGVFPVLGNDDWKLGQQICQVGSETGREKCGSILQKSAFVKKLGDKNHGYVAWQYPNTSQHITPGDSGGPVYAYVYNPDGSIKGVSALGINESYSCNKQKTICTNYFLPIATIMRILGVTVLNIP